MSGKLDVIVNVNCRRRRGRYHPLWNWFGYDEPNYTYGADGRKLLGELAALSGTPPHVRTHNLLTSGDGIPALKWGSTNAYCEDGRGNPVYDWTIIDRIFDAWVEAGAVPFIQVGFMPRDLSDDPGPYRHDWALESTYRTITTGWAVPPNDLGKWAGLIEAWASHLVERYGRERVGTWPWEVWNEPDGDYWKGTLAEFCAMYDAAAGAIRKVLPQARVGGPHTCGGFGNPNAQAFLRGFLQHVVDSGAPLEFVAFHAKGHPQIEDGHVRMGLRKHLLDIETNLAIVNEFASLRRLPVIVGESDPEGCAACSARVHPHNAYRNGPLYGAYVVEAMIRTYELARRAGRRIEGAVTWAFVFEDQPLFDGFRDLATNSIDKPVLNAFRMLGKLGGDWLEASSSHALGIEDILEGGVRGQSDVNAVATRDASGATVLIWNYHDDDLPEQGAARVALTIEGLPDRAVRLEQFRMDADHSNAFAVWQRMGSPASVGGADHERLEAAGKLAMTDAGERTPAEGRLKLALDLPRQGVVACRIEY